MSTKSSNASIEKVRRNAENALFSDNLDSYYITKLSHDLKSPLSIVMMQLELLWLTLENREEQLDPLIEIAMQNSMKLSRMINNFADLFRIQMGCMECRMERVDTVQVLRQICDIAQRYADSKLIKIEYNPQLPIKYIVTDLEKLERIVLNLISNAIKYSPENTCVKITVKIRKHGIVIFVQDFGTGMPPNEESAFNKETNLDIGAVLREETKGLGLTMVKALAARMGGSVFCRSETDIGSVFIVNLPEYNMNRDTVISRSLNSGSIIRQELSDIACKKGFY